MMNIISRFINRLAVVFIRLAEKTILLLYSIKKLLISEPSSITTLDSARWAVGPPQLHNI